MFLKLGFDRRYMHFPLCQFRSHEASQQRLSGAVPAFCPLRTGVRRSTDLDFSDAELQLVARLEARFESCSSCFLEGLS